MCGICGMYHTHSQRPVERDGLQAMMDSMAHRGPDDAGHYMEGPLGLGFRRLSIIDLSGGKQPMFNEDGTIVVVFNGEIYNYQEVRTALVAHGHVLHTNSDTEVIAHLYEDFGDDCVSHLRGMFAFAVWDSRRRHLLVARDRLGIKPLYYTLAGGDLVFGSEIKVLLHHPGVQARLSLPALGHFLSLKYVPAPHTMFENVVALPPGCLLTCDEQQGVQVRPYWDVAFTNDYDPRISEDEYTEQLDALLRECVRMHLMSDVPFGAFLSGGVDSSTIVALMSEFLNEPVKTFSVGFEGKGESESELPFARMVAERYATEHYDVMVTPQDYVDLSRTMLWHLDQPIADQATLATYVVSRLASQHVKMVLTGEGGDELFAGYGRYAGERVSPLFQHIPMGVRGGMLGLSRRLPGLRRPKLVLYALCHTDEVTRIFNWFPLFNSDMKAALLSDTLKHALEGHATRDVFAEQLARTNATHVLNRMLYVDTKLWLPDDLLARGDKLGMATSLEARVPFLDHKMVEFAASLPPNLKLKRLTRKYLLKKVSRRLLPDTIIDRKKKGFPVPIALWFREDIRSFVHDTLAPDTIKRRGLFDPAFVARLLHEHDTSMADHSVMLWGLINVELWHQLFLDVPIQRAAERVAV